MMTERTVAIVLPNVTKGVIVNVEVVAPEWVNDDPTHLIEYTEANPAAIGWSVVKGVVIVPQPEASDDSVA